MEGCPDDITLSYKQFCLSPLALSSELLSVKVDICFFWLQGECYIHMCYVFKYCEVGEEAANHTQLEGKKLQISTQIGPHVFSVACMLMDIKICSTSDKSKLIAVYILHPPPPPLKLEALHSVHTICAFPQALLW